MGMMRAHALILILGLSFIERRLASKMGPFDIVVRACLPCPDEMKGLNTIRIDNATINVYNRTVLLLSGEIVLEESMSDDIEVGIYLSQFTVSGIKKNYLSQKLGRICKVWREFHPKMFKFMLDSVFHEEKCPVGRGAYSMKDFVLTIFESDQLPSVFFYGHYYVDIILKRDSQVLGCFRYSTDIVRKRRKGSG